MLAEPERSKVFGQFGSLSCNCVKKIESFFGFRRRKLTSAEGFRSAGNEADILPDADLDDGEGESASK